MEYQKVDKGSLKYKLLTGLLFSILLTPLVLFGLIALLAFFINGETFMNLALSFGIIIYLATNFLFLIIGVIYNNLAYNNLGYRLDKETINLRQGVFSISFTNIPYIKIIQLSFDQGPLQRFFRVGNLFISQEDDGFLLRDIDQKSAEKIIGLISPKTNIQKVDIVSK